AAERNLGDGLQRSAGNEADPLGFRPCRFQGGEDAEGCKYPRGIGRNLEAGSDLAQRIRLLEDIRGYTPARKCKRGRQPRDAGTDDRYSFKGHVGGRSGDHAALTWKTQPGGSVCSLLSAGL